MNGNALPEIGVHALSCVAQAKHDRWRSSAMEMGKRMIDDERQRTKDEHYVLGEWYAGRTEDGHATLERKMSTVYSVSGMLVGPKMDTRCSESAVQVCADVCSDGQVVLCRL